ncbi:MULTISPECIES: sigma-54 dependent transcriptional regulator [Shewanella]|uniref:Sigma-54-dependent Fis family transcriptional regulator n=1 Tax=Shewanella psychromarinicola TaxID=2487742 RepID=A0A3N4DFJ0_9GAMM|nr:sigma-54 dependent transcriptional regulator [Shewanella psychromarinicola]AZG33733.1 sigma-54-dependent Fis family transcriptional regulator [Shewanella psychromarinicola]MCL1084015.1 sigma-54 dependent transcriptional regulator [Shewanella psychromarinicola]RPA22608.1 sigma-54-dependent Fis family transcriptional regulator [Shewanella psychromarinicola]
MEPLLMAGFRCNELNEVLCGLHFQLHYIDKYNKNKIPINCALCLIDLRTENTINEITNLVRELDPRIHIIVLINKPQLDIAEITTFIAQFAWDFYTSPIDPERLAKCLGHGLGLSKLKQQHAPQLESQCKDNEQFAYQSDVMRQLFRQVGRVAPTDIPVLIRGESGTGKELVATQLHQLSARKDGPFVTVNCGAMAAGLIQSELFGHEKGAFTGATSSRKGKIALANGGTLFLDEIGDLPAELQVNLLRFLQEGLYDSVGGSMPQSADVRILAATHVNLENAIDQGKFRLDLYYRLNGITIETPRLKERRDDIIGLANRFIRVYSDEYGLATKPLSQSACHALLNYPWPGNVRELINRVRRAVVLSDTQQITAQNLELINIEKKRHIALSLKTLKDNAEKQALQQAILIADGHVELAASYLDISRATFYRLMDKHDLELI